MICFALILATGTAAAFVVLVAGIHRAERRRTLLNQADHGNADTFTRRVLGVYVRQASDDREQVGR
jgi:hypothetical protein